MPSSDLALEREEVAFLGRNFVPGGNPPIPLPGPNPVPANIKGGAEGEPNS